MSVLGAETFPAIHKNLAWRDGKGTIEITGNGITFHTGDKDEQPLHWGWLDIQYFDRISETEFNILTYQDQTRFLGRDKSYRFVLTDGMLSDKLFAMISEKLGRPVTNRVVETPEKVLYEVPVKHQHPFGGCEGVLEFTEDAIYYVTDHQEDAREWLLARDVNSVWSADRYRLEIHVYDNNRREFSRTRIFKFDLKAPLDQTLYRNLKLKLYELEAAHRPLATGIDIGGE